MTILTVRHLTTYAYAAPVRLGQHRMMLRPRDSNDQRLLNARLDIEPRPHRLRWIHDVFDNCVAIADFAGETRRLRVENSITLEHIASDEPEFQLEERARTYPFSYDADEMPDLARAIERHYPDPAGDLDRWVRQFVNIGPPDRDGRAADDPDECDQGRPRSTNGERRRERRARCRRSRRGAAPAAILRP